MTHEIDDLVVEPSSSNRHLLRRTLIPKSLPVKLGHLASGVFRKAAAVAGLLHLLAPPAIAQQDPGVRGGLQNTAGYLQYRGIPIPHPPLISADPTNGATITANELKLFNEG